MTNPDEQYFLTDPEALRRLVTAAEIQPGDRVLELGSGGGTVAAALPPCELTLVEQDAKLARALRTRFSNATVLQADALEVLGNLEVDVVLSNLPSALTGAVLQKLNDKAFGRALLAVHENDDLSSLAQMANGLQLILLIPLERDAFTPPQPFRSKLLLATPRQALHIRPP